MATDNKNSNHLLHQILNAALIPSGFRPQSDSEIEAMLDTIGGESLSSDKLARMLRKINGKEPIGVKVQNKIDDSTNVLNETQRELVMLYRAKGRDIPPEIQEMLEDMRKRAANPEDKGINE